MAEWLRQQNSNGSLRQMAAGGSPFDSLAAASWNSKFFRNNLVRVDSHIPD